MKSVFSSVLKAKKSRGPGHGSGQVRAGVPLRPVLGVGGSPARQGQPKAGRSGTGWGGKYGFMVSPLL